MMLFTKDKSGEQGSVMIVALVILVLLTVIGISATSTTNIETQIAGNDKFHKIAFFAADSGVPVCAKLITTIMNDQLQPVLDAVTYTVNADDPAPLLSQIMGYEDYDGNDVTFEFSSSNSTVEIDVDRVSAQYLTGGSVEFGSGAEGVGGGAAGVAIIYSLDCIGSGPANSQSNIVAGYRKVIGVAGGL